MAERDAARSADTGGAVGWVGGDIAAWAPRQPAGVVLANASLHWVAAHDTLFPRPASTLAPGGVLAVQLPRNSDRPSHRILAEIAARPRWRDRVGGVAGPVPVDGPTAYHDRLAPHCAEVDIWETVYLQVLQGPDPVARWVESTAARPYLAALGPDGGAFLAEYAEAVAEHYPARPDGTTLFPCRRLFVIATR
jgi:trans-aconitate 2-methyltransferase